MELTKHHGLGNDFLVLLDVERRHREVAGLARAVCDRHTGVGADGLLRVSRGTGGADVVMDLHNADGGRAEMSGNGVACLAQAVVMADLVVGPTVTVQTDVGVRSIEVHPTEDPGTHDVTVDMGAVGAGADAPDWSLDGVEAARFADAGNPHLVLHTPDPERVPDLVTTGVAANAAVAGGVNVELIRVEDGAVRLDVYERGVGPTRACGTGAAAAAVVAAGWGLVDDPVAVVMPGGVAQLTLRPTVSMTVPIVAVARVDYLRA